MAFTLVSYNILRGGYGREDALASVIRASNADLVVLQEATSPRVVGRLAQAVGMAQWMARRGSSLAFMSRHPVRSYRWVRPAWAQHAILELVPQSGLMVFGVHLSAVHSNWTEWRRVREVRGLLAMVKVEAHDVHVVTGDFNTLAPGEALDLSRLPARLRAVTWLTGNRIRWKTVALMLEAGYVDLFRMVEPDGRGYTFPTTDPHLRLDYAFMPARDAVRLRSCKVLRPEAAGTASDHLPLETSIELGTLASSLQSGAAEERIHEIP
jgi:endonuclease/exonuclease/phosphatase family metal-dependent hydrolase